MIGERIENLFWEDRNSSSTAGRNLCGKGHIFYQKSKRPNFEKKWNGKNDTDGSSFETFQGEEIRIASEKWKIHKGFERKQVSILNLNTPFFVFFMEDLWKNLKQF